jgi:leucyl/phenylalanyl-tRNA--protein transferase
MQRRPPWLDASAEPAFPPLNEALSEPPGLLAVGGALTVPWLRKAYASGVFPWYEEGQPILWWAPDPRAVLYPEDLHLSRSLRKRLRSGRYRVSFDLAFESVVAGCAAPRAPGAGTWITAEMAQAYAALHRAGTAHSVEVWLEDQLVGGLYGVALGGAYFGESMFSRSTDASKVGLAVLVAHLRSWGVRLIDCQIPNPHLTRLGAVEIPGARFLEELSDALRRPDQPWQLNPGLDPLTDG